MKLFIGILGFHLILAGAFLAFANVWRGWALILFGLILLVYGCWPREENNHEESGDT